MMQIQTYECETVPSVEFTEEAIALCEKLGAAKQDTFYKQENGSCPYRLMTPEELAVYQIVLPQREEIDKYEAGPIPLRVLQVGAHAKDLLEGTLVIWHQGAGKDDPLLTLRQGSNWSGKYYLLARWGEVLEEYQVLFEHAVKRLALTSSLKIAECRRELEGWEAQVESKVRHGLQLGKHDLPDCHWYIS
jgi:hypothetical protein